MRLIKNFLIELQGVAAKIRERSSTVLLLLRTPVIFISCCSLFLRLETPFVINSVLIEMRVFKEVRSATRVARLSKCQHFHPDNRVIG